MIRALRASTTDWTLGRAVCLQLSATNSVIGLVLGVLSHDREEA